jgi:transcriptional antiterminator RfaH
MNPPVAHWFCLKAQPKREHIAADHLRQIPGVEVFLPRIRFQKKTARGPVWFTEALFPGYVFARFDFQTLLRQVRHATAIRGIVHFGEHFPAIPDETVTELRAAVGSENVCTIADPLRAGEEVEVAAGAFRGLKAVVTRVMPSRERVLVLLEFLGRQTSVELPAGEVLREGDQRRRAFNRG